MTGTLTINGYIMAGGASSRFGSDKALAVLAGKTMLERVLELAAQSGIANASVVGTARKYSGYGAVCIEDQWPGEGPLGGIITALEDAAKNRKDCQWNLILSCDMPFLTCEWIRFLCQQALASPAQVIVPHTARGAEPLCACWRTDAVTPLRNGFERGVRRVNDGIALLRSEVLDERDWKRFDSAGRLFWNMNTPADYEEARRILEAEQT